MALSRRGFLKALLAGGAASALPQVGRLIEAWAASPARNRTGRLRRWVMVIDLALCDGCKKCTDACQVEHFVPPGQEWIKVLEVRANPYGEPHYFPLPCLHCENAPCVKVCPVEATYHDEEGIVLIDHDRCIGCRYCMAACPYGARSFNWGEPPHTPEELRHTYSPQFPVPHRKGTVEKCMFCAHRVKEGRLPACVEACTRAGMKAIYFGDASEDVVTNGAEIVRLSALLSRSQAYRYKEELGTEPRLYYLPPRTG